MKVVKILIAIFEAKLGNRGIEVVEFFDLFFGPFILFRGLDKHDLLKKWEYFLGN